jgi:hypothetical protein
VRRSSLLGRAANLPAAPPPAPPGPRFRDPKTMTSQERRHRIAELEAKFCEGTGIDPTDTVAVFQSLIENAENRGDHEIAERWRKVADRRAAVFAPAALRPGRPS